MIEAVLSSFAYLASDSIWWLGPKIFLLVLAIAAINKLINQFVKKLVRFSKHSDTHWDEALLLSLHRPLSVLIWVVGITHAAELAWAELPAPIERFVLIFRKLGFVFCIAWFTLRFLRNIEKVIIAKHMRKRREGLDEAGIRAANKIVRVSIIITTALIAFSTMGYSVSGVLAFGGIGGIAIGFAAKDMLSNFFGGLMIYLDRPFTEGDWIRSPDREIEGTVEYIGWRQTRIRTFERRPMYVPNSIFAQIAVENPSRMESRRLREAIGVRYDDLSKVGEIVEDIKQMLVEHTQIDDAKLLIVALNKFDASSVNILVYTYVRETQGTQFYEIKQQVLLNIAEIIERRGAEIAFPTTTMHIASHLGAARASTSDLQQPKPTQYVSVAKSG